VPGQRPLLLLDVDGVLNPYAALDCPDGYTEFAFFAGEEPVRLCDRHAEWLADLAGAFDLAWATGWGPQANVLLAPFLGLPELPVITFPPAPFLPKEKVPAIASFADGRPAVWIDDMLTPEAYAWADDRADPTLLISADPAEGLVRSMVDEALSWAATLQTPALTGFRRWYATYLS
jgi:hypothetical protein